MDAMVRKVLKHRDFGLCVLLPKTEWPKLPERGTAIVTINGEPCRVVVQADECNCQGKGWHEHRFLSLPGTVKLRENECITITFSS